VFPACVLARSSFMLRPGRIRDAVHWCGVRLCSTAFSLVEELRVEQVLWRLGRCADLLVVRKTSCGRDACSRSHDLCLALECASLTVSRNLTRRQAALAGVGQCRWRLYFGGRVYNCPTRVHLARRLRATSVREPGADGHPATGCSGWGPARAESGRPAQARSPPRDRVCRVPLDRYIQWCVLRIEHEALSPRDSTCDRGVSPPAVI